jgi:hypothetical protein
MLERLIAIFLTILLSGLPQGVFAQGTARTITTPCNAHLGSLTESTPHAYEKYFEWTNVPSAAAAFANKKLPNTIEMVAVAPVTTDDYKAIFSPGNAKDKTSITEAQRKEIEGVQATLKTQFGRDKGDRAFNKNDYKKVLQAKAASFVIVIGHNEDGMLGLLDGNSIYLDEVVASARPGQRIILISCQSGSRVSSPQTAGTISRWVTYSEAFEIASQIIAFIKGAGGPLSLAEIQAQLTQHEGAQTTHKVAFFIMKAVCFGAAVVVVALSIRELDPCKDKDAPCPDSNKHPKNDNKKNNSAAWLQRDMPDRCDLRVAP